MNGHEEDCSPPNKFFTCRRCNVLCANALRRAGLGRKTHQFNPASRATGQGATNLGAWMNAVTSLRGEGGTMVTQDAIDLIHATSPEQRSEFAKEIWNRRRSRHGPSGRRDALPF